MYRLEKEKFGPFISELRKTKGFTQKELACLLNVSDKAVSKWETGHSIPDTGLLIPLSEILGVSVTELLSCKLLDKEDTLQKTDVEELVKTAVSYPKEMDKRIWQTDRKVLLLFLIAMLLEAILILLNYKKGFITEAVYLCAILSTVFGAYFSVFARIHLPSYYDENRISGMQDGPVRMNIPGVHLNNSNWPYMLKTGRIAIFTLMMGFPILSLIGKSLYPTLWYPIESYLLLVLLLIGLFIPMIIVGRKYENLKTTDNQI